MKSSAIRLLLASLCVIVIPRVSQGQSPDPLAAASDRAGPELRVALQQGRVVAVVVALRAPLATPSQLASMQSEIRATQNRVLSQLGPGDFTLRHQWRSIPGFAGELTPSGLEALLGDPDVLRVDLDSGGSGHLAVSVPLIRADQVQALGYLGGGVTVAVLDSGIQEDHPDLASALVGEECFCTTSIGGGCCPGGTTRASGPGSAADDNGHGTNVSGIVASAGTISSVGVAPGASLYALKVLASDNSFATTAQVISALDWIINNPQSGVQVINMSLGTFALFPGICDNANSFTMEFQNAIDTLKTQGVTTFASSGNQQDLNQMSAPACVSSAVAVGAVYKADVGSVTILGCTDATTAADKVTCFSNSSTKLDLLAPGAPIVSTGIGGGLSTFYGTSQASPHAAGTAALMLSANPLLAPDQIKSILQTTGISVTDPRNSRVTPRIDALNAVNAVLP